MPRRKHGARYGKGHRGVVMGSGRSQAGLGLDLRISTIPGGIRSGRPLQDLDVAVHWPPQIFSAGLRITIPPPWKGFSPNQGQAMGPAGSFSMTQAQFIPNLIFSGVLDRFPRLKWVCAETGVGWVKLCLRSLRSRVGAPPSVDARGSSTRPSETVPAPDLRRLLVREGRVHRSAPSGRHRQHHVGIGFPAPRLPSIRVPGNPSSAWLTVCRPKTGESYFTKTRYASTGPRPQFRLKSTNREFIT